VRVVVAWLGALLTLLVLWPAVCMSSEDGPTSCVSVLSTPLPWGESADTWGMVAALVASGAVFWLLRTLLRRGRPGGPTA
jgi:hypothetical protein